MVGEKNSFVAEGGGRGRGQLADGSGIPTVAPNLPSVTGNSLKVTCRYPPEVDYFHLVVRNLWIAMPVFVKP